MALNPYLAIPLALLVVVALSALIYLMVDRIRSRRQPLLALAKE